MTVPDATAAFSEIFGGRPAFLVRAPGRVNLIGDHVDYCGGLVLPMAIDRAVLVAGRGTDTGTVEVHSSLYEQRVRIPLASLVPDADSPWCRYVVGVLTLLRRHGVALRGMDLWIGSQLPPGGGLSSSAALEVGVALAALAAADSDLDKRELALLCRDAEHEFAGSPCGIMDQLCCTSTPQGHALLIDCQSLYARPVALRLGDTELVVIDSGVRHSIAGGEYALRRRQCELALAAIRARFPHTGSLAQIPIDELADITGTLTPLLAKRVRHVATETERVRQTALLLESGNLEEVGRLMADSHVSLRDDFKASCPELDCLVDAAMTVDGVFGARMTGGGFGGCVIALVRNEAVSGLRTAVASAYESRFSGQAEVLAVHSAGAARVSHLS